MRTGLFVPGTSVAPVQEGSWALVAHFHLAMAADAVIRVQRWSRVLNKHYDGPVMIGVLLETGESGWYDDDSYDLSVRSKLGWRVTPVDGTPFKLIEPLTTVHDYLAFQRMEG